jgi:hypothetical protein
MVSSTWRKTIDVLIQITSRSEVAILRCIHHH